MQQPCLPITKLDRRIRGPSANQEERTLSQLVVTVEMVVDIPNRPFTAKVTRVVNSMGQDITATFQQHCKAEDLPLTSQSEIEAATESFTKKYGGTIVLP